MLRHCWFVVLAALAAGTAHAQPAALTQSADPAQKAPPLTYQSPFADYRPFKVQPREEWPAVNDRVRDVGGHVGALQDEGPTPPAAAPKPNEAPPAGHQH
jgi:hypothetical protein